MRHFAELENLRLELGIPSGEMCIVGSAALVVAGGRPNSDLDLAVRPRTFDQIRRLNRFSVTPGGAINLSDSVQIGKSRYAKIGISDEDVFSEEFSSGLEGYWIIRPEVEFAFKTQRGRPKDAYDVNDLAQSDFIAHQFDWSLVHRCLQAAWQTKHFERTQDLGLVVGRLRKFLPRLKAVISQPGRAVRVITRTVRRQLLRQLPGSFSRSGNQFSVQIKETVSVGVLLQAEIQGGRFNRYDVLLRWAAIESVVGKLRIDGALQHYWNMQSARVGRTPSRRFTQFVESVKSKGLDSRYPVVLSESGRLLDGAHRVAAALHLDSDSIAIQRSHRQPGAQYGREWFQEHGFPETLLEDLDRLASRAFLSHGVFTTLILWPPARTYWDQAESFVRELGTCVASETVVLGDRFTDTVRQIHAVDDIDWWQIEVKLSAMREHPPSIRLLLLDLTDGSFRPKKRTGSHLPREGAEIKRQVRNRFAQNTPGYVHDIICHTGDNQAHSREILRILTPWVSIEDLSERVRVEAGRSR